MAGRVLGREAELAVVDQVLMEATLRPSVLCVRGEPGIGKTTLLEATCVEAGTRGFTILRCGPDSTETGLSYAGLIDLLQPIAHHMGDLAGPQRYALEAALLQRGSKSNVPDVHAVLAGTLSVITAACVRQPVLLAVDDLQWLDESTVRALAFALRRCRGRYALATTLRAGFDLPAPEFAPAGDETSNLELGGLEVASLHAVVAARLGPLDRPTMEHIAAVSRGNPLFAQELALRIRNPGNEPMPSTLTAGMSARYLALPAETREVLLLCSATANPTAELLSRAGAPSAVAALTAAEGSGVVAWHGNRLLFSHPMWREVITRTAEPDAVRAAHLRLSRAVPDIEERARHLVLSSPILDRSTVTALSQAANAARSRGAPAHAADLQELALSGGVTDPRLRLQTAIDHLAGGRVQAARRHAVWLVEELPAGTLRAAALSLLGEITFVVDDYPAAISFLEQAYCEAGDEPATRITAGIDLAFAHANLGNNDLGLTWASRAEEIAVPTGDTALTAEAVGAVAVMRFLTGTGIDHDRIERALANEDLERTASPIRWPSMSAGLLSLWSHDLSQARMTLAAVRQRCTDRGLERGLFLLLPRIAEAALLQGDTIAAEAYARELEERASMSGGDSVLASALALRVVLTAHTGDLKETEHAYQTFLEIADGDRHLLVGLVALAALGSCQLAAGKVDSAADNLEPVALVVLAFGLGEPVISPYFADCIDVAAATGHIERATAIIEVLEAWAARSGTRWPAGISARGRAVLALQDGALDAAAAAADQALTAFDAPGLDYEEARTLLTYSRIHRRRRERAKARERLIAAETIFTRLGAAGWAAQAHREFDQLGLQRTPETQLTPSERRIAELSAAGHTNASIAARLAISPKTVEAHLTRIYQKLRIHSRAELGQWIATTDHGRSR